MLLSFKIRIIIVSFMNKSTLIYQTIYVTFNDIVDNTTPN